MNDGYMDAAAIPDAEDDTLREGLAWAMRGTTDGDLMDPSSEIPIGEAERLAYEFIREHVAEAWDEGYEVGCADTPWEDGATSADRTPNPYREADHA